MSSQTFISALLSGPTTVFTRLKASLADTPCTDLPAAAYARFSDPRSYWFAALETGVSGASEKAGVRMLRQATDSLANKQTEMFDAYESMTASMLTYNSRVSQGGPEAEKANQDLIEWIEASTMLGLHSGAYRNTQLKPALSWAINDGQYKISVAERERLAIMYLYAPI